MKTWLENPDLPVKLADVALSRESRKIRLQYQMKIVKIVLSYLEHMHDDNHHHFEFPPEDVDALHYVKVYRVALTLG